MRQWERLQTNSYMYSNEILPCTDDKEYEVQLRRLNAALSPSALKIETTFDSDAKSRRTLQIEFHKNIKQNIAIWRSHALNYSIAQRDPGGNRDKSWRDTMSKQIELMSKQTQEEFHMRQRQLEVAAKKKGLHKAEIALTNDFHKTKGKQQRKSAILRSIHCDDLDMLIGGYEDGRIRTFLFD